MGKAEIYAYLAQRGIWYEVTEHPAVYNMAELSTLVLPYPEADAKNLFLRDDKKRNYYLVTVKGEKRVDLKEFRKAQGTRPLSFASAEELAERMGLTPGAVSPLGILNDHAGQVQLVIDDELAKGAGRVGVHPNDNTATVWLRTADLVKMIEEHGNPVTYMRL
ncbi:prolyl-tRNA synthetase associated domain-containing protein [Candidatus Enterococcus huntleyi]|uniref:prolyl-tRNA synthetase associated domain-containing protein n=1 Tax=Candidatus Enterococcus huntleyi TaxID=1857217 RepID=UPI00137A3034|nr:prolyl-tRNA synthetase associated domain-containing protein [Enterococcus sp. JM4C]